jgi:uncharacterized membrane protein YdbT with pleckstrin-like domain
MEPTPEIVLRPSPRIMYLALALYLIFAVGVFVALVQLRFGTDVPREALVVVWRIALGIGAIWLVYLYLRFRTTVLVLDKQHVTKASGIIAKTYSRVELGRISNYVGQVSVLSRILGLIDLRIDTPGGMGDAEVRVRFLDFKQAQAFLKRLGELRVGAV